MLAARFGQRLPNAHLHNAYGPTETTVDATGTAMEAHVPIIFGASCTSSCCLRMLHLSCSGTSAMS